MIEVNHDSILDKNGDLSSIKWTAKEIKELSHFKRIRFTIFDYMETFFENLLKKILASLLKSFKIYLIYIESKAQPKSKIRSYKKMFYQERKNNLLHENDLHDREIDINPKESLMTGLITLSEQNMNYVLKHLINSNFRFGYLVKKGKKSFPKNMDSFLGEIINYLDGRSNISRLNFTDLLLSQVKKNKNIFRIPFSVNDKDFIEFLVREEDEEINKTLLSVEQKYKGVLEN